MANYDWKVFVWVVRWWGGGFQVATVSNIKPTCLVLLWVELGLGFDNFSTLLGSKYFGTKIFFNTKFFTKFSWKFFFATNFCSFFDKFFSNQILFGSKKILTRSFYLYFFWQNFVWTKFFLDTILFRPIFSSGAIFFGTKISFAYLFSDKLS